MSLQGRCVRIEWQSSAAIVPNPDRRQVALGGANARFQCISHNVSSVGVPGEADALNRSLPMSDE